VSLVEAGDNELRSFSDCRPSFTPFSAQPASIKATTGGVGNDNWEYIFICISICYLSWGILHSILPPTHPSPWIPVTAPNHGLTTTHSKTFPPPSLAKSTLKSGKSTQNTASPFNRRILSPSANPIISIQRRILSCYFESFRLVCLPDWSDKREAFEMAQQQGQNVMRRYDFQQFCYVLGTSVPEMSEVGSSNPLQRNRDPLIADTLEIIQWTSMPCPPLI
jgi:hypothetical protein